VSIAAETNGILREILRVSLVPSWVSLGKTAEYAGTKRTSSKVSAFLIRRIKPLHTKYNYKGFKKRLLIIE
jgi:predicted HTH domain antitoxin